MSAICIIPAKGTSRRLPRKNIREFCGQPMIAYSINTAKESCLFDKILVSTDDVEIADLAVEMCCDVLWRPGYLCEHDGAPDVGTQEVARHAIYEEWAAGRAYDYACCLYPCAPMVTIQDLGAALHALVINGNRFVKGVDAHGCDAGQFYFGHSYAFTCRLSLETAYLQFVEHAIDINTPEDWARAEQLYKEMHK